MRPPKTVLQFKLARQLITKGGNAPTHSNKVSGACLILFDGVTIVKAVHKGKAHRWQQGDGKARSDKVGFLEIRRDASSPQCMKLFHRMEAAVGTLSWSDGGPLLCPKFGMAAVYDGAGSFYAAHRDNEHHSGEAKWVNFRSLTAVMYINPSGFQSAEDGGSLRCFVDAAASDLTGASAKEIQVPWVQNKGCESPWRASSAVSVKKPVTRGAPKFSPTLCLDALVCLSKCRRMSHRGFTDEELDTKGSHEPPEEVVRWNLDGHGASQTRTVDL
eukprot:s776_g4.t1